ncbi:hypothetical protein BKA63DRAFT_507443 [Paraphoma chrysanthemicola]|nr:hypothetical protein BKA63DRAFT_507443 [Paraphoma chrysanthemicola]
MPRPVASVACWCSDNTSKNHDKSQRHRCRCGVRWQQMSARSTTVELVQAPESSLGAGSGVVAMKRPIPPAEATAQKIWCACGRKFANEKRLKEHLRYSTTHEAERLGSGSTPKGRTSVSVPFTAPQSNPTSTPLVLGPVTGTIPSSVLTVASLISCTCGHTFETKRILQLHKRNSLYHKREADKSLTHYQQEDNSLVSSLASMRLEPVSTQAGPSIARCASKKAPEKPKEKGQLARPGKEERREKPFRTPRPQYQEDEYLRDMSAALARQNCIAEQ